MTNEKIILKVQEIQAHIEMLSRKIDEYQPQEVKEVVVDFDFDAIVEQSVTQCKKLIVPLKAQNTKLKNDNAIIVEELKSKIDEGVKTNKIKIDKINELNIKNNKNLTNSLKAQNTKLKNDNAIIVEDLTGKIDLLTKENNQIKKSVEGLRLNIEKEILKVTKNINAVNSTFNDCTDVLSENLKRNIKSNAKSQSAKLEDLQLIIESNNKQLDKKISMVSDEAEKQFIENIAHAIDEKVNINFVNNLYRNK